MKLEKLAANCHLLMIDGDHQVLFSYDQPVAAMRPDGFYKVTRLYTKHTAQHIKKFLGSWPAQDIEADFFENFIGQGK